MPETSAPRRLPLAVTGLCLVQFMDVLGVTVVITALPSMLAAPGQPVSHRTRRAGGLRKTRPRGALG